MTSKDVQAGHGRALEVFLVFLRLGVTSFGGPVAHLGYFRNEFVVRRRWVEDAAYGDLIALCQFLPGPASSQVGFSLGILRTGGLLGGLAAWCGFTLPSAVLMLIIALGARATQGTLAQGLIHGLKLVAVAVVAQAVWGMSRTLTPDRTRAAIALAAVLVVVLGGGSIAQVGAIAAGAALGLAFCREPAPPATGDSAFPISRTAGLAALVLFAVLLLAPPLLLSVDHDPALALFNAFYQSGAFVFGGGHVVLPLLQAQVVTPGWVDAQTFLAGYGAAQAMPGPLFTLAAYLGAVAKPPPTGAAGSAIALAAIFLPGLLLVYGALPFWSDLRRYDWAQAALRGANAAVVGVLAVALYSPVWVGAVLSPADFAIALAGFLLLTVWRLPSWSIVVLLGLCGMLETMG